MSRLVLAAFVIALSAGVAAADPVIDQVSAATARTGVVTVTVEATLSARGEVTVTGDLNGRPVELRKRMRASHRTLKFVVNPRRYGLGRNLTENLRFNLTAAATETDSGARTTRDLFAFVPVPCVAIPGLANEQTPGGFAAFTAALDLAAGGRYSTGARRPFLVVHEYKSLSKSLATLGAELDRTIRLTLRGTPFGKVDLVGYSYGGVVARSYMAQKGGSRVRTCAFLGSPNKGTPIAYIGVGLLERNLLAGLLGSDAGLAEMVGGLVNDQTKGSLRNLYPTYTWLEGDPFSVFFALSFLGDTTTPLAVLNQKAPPFGVRFEAYYYSSTPGDQLGTVDHVDVSAFSSVISGGTPDPAAFATGSGDGVVPAHSVTMESTTWAAAITGHDLGAGTHLTLPLDPNVHVAVAALLAQ